MEQEERSNPPVLTGRWWVGWGGLFFAGGGKKPHKRKGVVASFQAVFGRFLAFFGRFLLFWWLLLKNASAFLCFLVPGAAGRRRHENRTAVAFLGAVL